MYFSASVSMWTRTGCASEYGIQAPRLRYCFVTEDIVGWYEWTKVVDGLRKGLCGQSVGGDYIIQCGDVVRVR